MNDDSLDGSIDWWVATIPANVNTNGAQIRYKIALYNDNVGTISDALDEALRPDDVSITISTHHRDRLVLNNLKTNDTITGLKEGYHIVRAHAYLPRDGKSGVFNTFLRRSITTPHRRRRDYFRTPMAAPFPTAPTTSSSAPTAP